MGYTIYNRTTNEKLFSTGAQRADDYIQKGNPVIPIGLRVKVDDLKPGSYRLIMQAVDGAKNHAPDRTVDFDVTE
jgi:hypothetical protein